MTNGRRWSSDIHEVMRVQYLEWLSDRDADPHIPRVLDFQQTALDTNHVLAVAQSLEHDGLVNLQRSMGNETTPR